MKPGDLVRVRFWDEHPPSPLIGIIIEQRPAKFFYENTNFYKVYVFSMEKTNGFLMVDFAVEELQLIQEAPCLIKK